MGEHTLGLFHNGECDHLRFIDDGMMISSVIFSFFGRGMDETTRFDVWGWVKTYDCSINFSGMNIQLYQLCWGSLGARVLTHSHTPFVI